MLDAVPCAVLDIHCSAHWPHDTYVGHQIALRNTTKVESLAGDKGYDGQWLQDALGASGVRLVIRHRMVASYDHVCTARLDSELYRQRNVTETAFSAISHRYGSAAGHASSH